MLAIHCQILMIAKSTMGDGFQRLSRRRYKANHPDIEPTDFGGFVQNPLHHDLEIKRVQNRTANLLQRLQLTRAVRRIICTNLNFSPLEKIKAALRDIKVVSANGYAKGEERPYGNRVYNRTNGISATGAAPSDREI